MDMSDLNLGLDIVLIVASLWMIYAIRGLGGIVGRAFNLIVAGTVVLGLAHFLATVGTSVLEIEGPTNNFIHRLIVLLGFILLGFGFRQIRELRA